MVLISALVAFAQPYPEEGPDTLWTRIITEPYRPLLGNAHPLPDGGCAISGSHFNGTGHSLFLLELDSLGQQQALHIYGVPNATVAGGYTAPLADGGYGFAAYTSPTGGMDLFAMGTGASGDTLWTRIQQQPQTTYSPWATCPSWEGGFIWAGNKGLFDISNHHWVWHLFWANFAANGDTLWTRQVPEDNKLIGCSIYGITPTPDSGYAMTGDYSSDTLSRAFLMKTDRHGQVGFLRPYDTGRGASEGRGIVALSDGYVIASGAAWGPDYPYAHIYLIRTNLVGDTLWTRVFLDRLQDRVQRILMTPTGDVTVVSGVSTGGLSTVRLTCVTTDGEVRWQREYPVGFDENWDETATVDAAGRYTIATRQWEGMQVIRTEAYGSAGVSPKWESHQPAVVQLFPNYPNPFNAVTRLRYSLRQATRVVLKVYDVLGREVAVLEERTVPAGEHQITFDGSNLSSGAYFCRLQAGGQVQTRKLVLLK